jgi:hypothetical protein
MDPPQKSGGQMDTIKAGSLLSRGAVMRLGKLNVAVWPTEPPTVRSSNGVICYAPTMDALICVPCQCEVGTAGRAELGEIRPAISDDIRRIGCCTSCGVDLLEPTRLYPIRVLPCAY